MSASLRFSASEKKMPGSMTSLLIVLLLNLAQPLESPAAPSPQQLPAEAPVAQTQVPPLQETPPPAWERPQPESKADLPDYFKAHQQAWEDPPEGSAASSSDQNDQNAASGGLTSVTLRSLSVLFLLCAEVIIFGGYLLRRFARKTPLLAGQGSRAGARAYPSESPRLPALRQEWRPGAPARRYPSSPSALSPNSMRNLLNENWIPLQRARIPQMNIDPRPRAAFSPNCAATSLRLPNRIQNCPPCVVIFNAFRNSCKTAPRTAMSSRPFAIALLLSLALSGFAFAQ